MRHLSKTVTNVATLLKQGQVQIRSRRCLAEEYENVMRPSDNKQDYLSKPRFSREDHPYLTAGGRHEIEVENIIYNIRNYLDRHYLQWKLSQR